MKRKGAFCIRIFVAVLVIALSLAAYKAAYYFTVKFYENDEPNWRPKDEGILKPQPVEDDVVETTSNPLFLLLEKDGYVIIEYFQGGSLYDETNILVEDLPDDLQEKIYNGIPINNFEELYDFLENYSS